MRVEPTLIFNSEEFDLLHDASSAWGVLLSEAERLERAGESPADAERFRKLAEFVRMANGMSRGASWNVRQVTQVLQGLDALQSLCKQQIELPDSHWFSDGEGNTPTATPLVLDTQMAIQVIRDSRERQRGKALEAAFLLQETNRVIHEAQQAGTDAVYRVWPVGWDAPGWKVMGVDGCRSGPYRTQDEAEYAEASQPY
jgi:hypothetical protein